MHALLTCAGTHNRPNNRGLAAIHQSLPVSDQVPSNSGTAQSALLSLSRYHQYAMPGAAEASVVAAPLAVKWLQGIVISSVLTYPAPPQQLFAHQQCHPGIYW
jgi:hypothetical protein